LTFRFPLSFNTGFNCFSNGQRIPLAAGSFLKIRLAKQPKPWYNDIAFVNRDFETQRNLRDMVLLPELGSPDASDVSGSQQQPPYMWLAATGSMTSSC
jgi:hypothetical protein